MQNIQARVRMVSAYLLAQLALYFGQKPGSLLVLGSSNVDEVCTALFSLVGYMTKYDCSSADFNPIGSLNKTDLRDMLKYARNSMGFSSLSQIIDAPSTAELLPRGAGSKPQLDEVLILLSYGYVEIGLTYEELAEIGLLRKPGCFGPYSTFLELRTQWRHKPVEEVVHYSIKKSSFRASES
ncbi:unnamed protein product [Gongylonema pulchrum]|uniref:NAD_synthase domain-containing protein n=1 Tax=Gongylonema pulchrum TaxID=637853 RepID=A0A183ED39_9BILA|nr:unnamed protein product [Gongylonema pulchrum]